MMQTKSNSLSFSKPLCLHFCFLIFVLYFICPSISLLAGNSNVSRKVLLYMSMISMMHKLTEANMTNIFDNLMTGDYDVNSVILVQQKSQVPWNFNADKGLHYSIRS